MIFIYDLLGALTGPINYYRSAVQAPPDKKTLLKKIAVPVLSLFGTADKYLSVSAEKGGADFVDNFQNVLLDGVSHFSMEQRPDEINQHIDNYLKKMLS